LFISLPTQYGNFWIYPCKHRWKNDIIMVLRELGCDSVDWRWLAQDKVQ